MQAITENRPIITLTLFDGQKCYSEMTLEDGKKVIAEKRRFILTDGNVISYSLVARMDKGTGVDFYKAFIYEKMPLQIRRDFLEIMRESERTRSKLSLEAVLYYLEQKKKQREYYSPSGMTEEQKTRRKEIADQMVARMKKFFNQ